MYEFIPDELKQLPNWVCWQAIPDPKSHSGISKIPVNPKTGGQAMSNNPQTWGTFQQAVDSSYNFAGIGFMFSESGYFGVDVDDVKEDIQDYLSGNHNNIVGEFADTLQSYTELSQSKNGIHVICKGILPEGGRRKGNVEMYDSGRFFVMTGNYCSEYIEISDGTESIKSLHKKYFGEVKKSQTAEIKTSVSLDNQSIIDLALNSKTGDSFRRLYNGDFSDYPSQSEGEMAFCSMLAFWCGGDAGKIDEIYRNSGLMREKWDRRQSGSTYGKLTIAKAIRTCSNFYNPKSKSSDYSISIGAKATATKIYSFDDTGNAERLHDLYGDILRYSYTDKRWVYYSEGKWSYDNVGYSRTLVDSSVEMMKQEQALCADYDRKNDTDMEKQFVKHLKKSRSFSGKTNMLHEFEHYDPVIPAMLDKCKHILNCKNGMVNLKTGELMPHDKKALITKIARCDYDSTSGKPEKWLSFLNDIFGGDLELIRYIQKAIGYSLSGSTTEQCAFFLYGTGRNGKSTFLEVVRSIMGDYATNIQPQTIMVKPSSGNSPNSDIARLKGARFVTSVEPNEGMRIDEGLLKQLTGDDVVTARKLYGDEFEFKPEFKLWMATNHKPVIRGTDTGIWRRIHLIPFTVQIPLDKVDRHLKYKLAEEFPAILKWAIDGCRLWQSEGLAMPKAVLDAVREYQHEMDVISAFTDACCIIRQGEVKSSVLYAVYAQWAEENNEYKMSSTKFGVEVCKRFEKVKKRDGLFYRGISLDSDSYSISIG